MSKPVRVRFAPSPTGPLHIGGVRTALFNYLFAKKHGGDFVLRIEDTDQNRYVEGAEEYIKSALDWCGIPFDGGPGKEGEYGPYRQSERKAHYRKYAMQLIEKGHAYYAFDTPENLDFHRKDHEQKGKTFIYNWHNRLKLDNSLSLMPEQVRSRIEAGEPYVVRFLNPPDVELLLNDEVRGGIKIDTNTLDDKVLFKSDGMPTYHLANIVDDHLMEITHVIRGEEWLPSLPLHYQLYAALDWEPPIFAHLPLIMKPTGKGKLSKRDGEKGGFPVFPLAWKEAAGYREEGYFPEAVVNFLALLGWNPGTEQEMFSLKELVAAFDIARVNKSGARFDIDKTKWYNQQYLQQKTSEELLPYVKEDLAARKLSDHAMGDTYTTKVIELVKERAVFAGDFWDLAAYFYETPKSYDPKALKKQWKPETAEYLQGIYELIENTEEYNSVQLEQAVKGYITGNDLPFGKVMGPLRLVVVGALKGPHLFDILALLGKEETLLRIQNALNADFARA